VRVAAVPRYVTNEVCTRRELRGSQSRRCRSTLETPPNRDGGPGTGWLAEAGVQLQQAGGGAGAALAGTMA
jgi:hypothetical protein